MISGGMSGLYLNPLKPQLQRQKMNGTHTSHYLSLMNVPNITNSGRERILHSAFPSVLEQECSSGRSLQQEGRGSQTSFSFLSLQKSRLSGVVPHPLPTFHTGQKNPPMQGILGRSQRSLFSSVISGCAIPNRSL